MTAAHSVTLTTRQSRLSWRMTSPTWSRNGYCRNCKIKPTNSVWRGSCEVFFVLINSSEITKLAKTGVVSGSDDNMVKDFDFQKLTGADEITGHFDVGFTRRRVTTYAAYGISGVMPHPVLCRMANDSARFSGPQQLLD